MPQFSILDLVRLGEDWGVRGAVDRAVDLAAHAEQWGYTRFWVAEHHNMPGVASSATSLLIGHIAAGTKTIRVGSGGIMLPNHAPLVIAEQFGTLAHLYPNRIDLGLGRAPGTDQATMRALRRAPAIADHFPQDVLELQAFLAPERDGQTIVASPGVGTEVPIWILGSSTFGAQLAAHLGLPFSFASHFAPDLINEALGIYRDTFRPSKQLERSYASVGVHIVAADTDAEAHRLATTQKMMFANMARGNRPPLLPPIDDIETYWTPPEKAQAMRMLARTIIGSRESVKAQLEALIAETGADEVMTVADIYDHEARLKSFRIIAEVMSEIR